MAMFNFRFPPFRYPYPYNRFHGFYPNRINQNDCNSINKTYKNTNSNMYNNKNINSTANNLSSNASNSFHNSLITNRKVANHESESNINSSITDNCNTANKNGFLNFIPKNIGPISINVDGFEDINKPLFDFLGIKLFLDDIIIICLLIFLYQQKVQDESLYLILILLLLT